MIDAVLRVFVKVEVGIEWYEVSFFFHDANTRGYEEWHRRGGDLHNIV